MSAWRIGTEATDPLGDVRRGVKTRGEQAAPKGNPALQQFQVFFDNLTKWIPGDTLAFYIPGVTFFSADGGGPSVPLLIVMIVVTPLFVILAAFSTGRKFTKRVWASAVLAAIAFLIWSMSVPLSGWQQWQLVASHPAGFSIGAAIAGVLFGYVAEGVLVRLTPGGNVITPAPQR